jgi:hypothetical protein
MIERMLVCSYELNQIHTHTASIHDHHRELARPARIDDRRSQTVLSMITTSIKMAASFRWLGVLACDSTGSSVGSMSMVLRKESGIQPFG